MAVEPSTDPYEMLKADVDASKNRSLHEIADLARSVPDLDQENDRARVCFAALVYLRQKDPGASQFTRKQVHMAAKEIREYRKLKEVRESKNEYGLDDLIEARLVRLDDSDRNENRYSLAVAEEFQVRWITSHNTHKKDWRNNSIILGMLPRGTLTSGRDSLVKPFDGDPQFLDVCGRVLDIPVPNKKIIIVGIKLEALGMFEFKETLRDAHSRRAMIEVYVSKEGMDNEKRKFLGDLEVSKDDIHEIPYRDMLEILHSHRYLFVVDNLTSKPYAEINIVKSDARGRFGYYTESEADDFHIIGKMNRFIDA